MMDRSRQTIALIGLLVTFLFVPSISNNLGTTLDILPVRIAAVLVILASIAYDKFIALGVFMVIAAIYIQRHQDDLNSINISGDKMSFNQVKSPGIMENLEKGGHASESHDEMDFMSKQEDQDNEFHGLGSSIDEKHLLQSEGLGSKSQSLFPDDAQHADSLMHGNRNGNHD